MEPRYYIPTQIANTLSSGVGLFLSLPGMLALTAHAVRSGNSWYVVSCIIYGLSLVISYASFTLYHIFKFHERLGKVFKILDHSTIFFLIAGTYTPFALVPLRGNWGWTLFGAVWGGTAVGVIFKIFFVHRFKLLSPMLYLFMGWLIILAIKPAVELIPREGLHLLLSGGLFYSFGLFFFAWKRLLFHHAIWHLFVLAGSICHYFAVYYHVTPHAAM
ncbi:hemolysin III family protein [Desulfococcus sp.]|uniref:PAQR family membrane homeostasis protein TrhA n=1 Tax=Desulfococcus sp. TaxID=2025834 RepID=UPI0035937213